MNALWELDQSLFREVHLVLHHPWADPLFWIISSTGLGWVQAAFLAVFCLDFKNLPKGRFDWLWPVAWSGILAGLSNPVLKQVFARERPSNFEWATPQEDIYFRSFPSGHSAGSFALAMAFVLLNPDLHWKWKAVAIGWAVLVGFSRIYRGVHWPTDVLGGFANGALAAVIVVAITIHLRARPSRQDDAA
ncbi:MAG: phosphatase PAP2 family protein [Fimbriimonadaceae bacterium]